MFTGLIEETGILKSISIDSSGAKLKIGAKVVLGDIKLGDSISLNGACQSVVGFDSNSFTVETSNETLEITTLKDLQPGQIVNLERALKLSDRLGGHMVLGHVDFRAKVTNIINDGFCKKMKFEANTRYIVQKGSITIDGISLTVNEVQNNSFCVEIIPKTYEVTNLKYLKTGDFVNIETDIVGRYIEKFLCKDDNGSKINEEFLKEHGFL